MLRPGGGRVVDNEHELRVAEQPLQRLRRAVERWVPSEHLVGVRVRVRVSPNPNPNPNPDPNPNPNQVRFATNLLVAARQLEVVTNLSAAQVGHASQKRSPPVGGSWTDSLEGTVGVATHHDGMSGTERQSVTDDYAQRISESSVEVEA